MTDAPLTPGRMIRAGDLVPADAGAWLDLIPGHHGPAQLVEVSRLDRSASSTLVVEDAERVWTVTLRASRRLRVVEP